MDERRDTRMNQGNAFMPMALGFIAGAITGAAVALLLAPASGKDLRARIGGVYHESADLAARLARTAFAEAWAEEHASTGKDAEALAAANTH